MNFDMKLVGEGLTPEVPVTHEVKHEPKAPQGEVKAGFRKILEKQKDTGEDFAPDELGTPDENVAVKGKKTGAAQENFRNLIQAEHAPEHPGKNFRQIDQDQEKPAFKREALPTTEDGEKVLIKGEPAPILAPRKGDHIDTHARSYTPKEKESRSRTSHENALPESPTDVNEISAHAHAASTIRADERRLSLAGERPQIENEEVSPLSDATQELLTAETTPVEKDSLSKVTQEGKPRDNSAGAETASTKTSFTRREHALDSSEHRATSTRVVDQPVTRSSLSDFSSQTPLHDADLAPEIRVQTTGTTHESSPGDSFTGNRGKFRAEVASDTASHERSSTRAAGNVPHHEIGGDFKVASREARAELPFTGTDSQDSRNPHHTPISRANVKDPLPGISQETRHMHLPGATRHEVREQPLAGTIRHESRQTPVADASTHDTRSLPPREAARHETRHASVADASTHDTRSLPPREAARHETRHAPVAGAPTHDTRSLPPREAARHETRHAPVADAPTHDTRSLPPREAARHETGEHPVTATTGQESRQAPVSDDSTQEARSVPGKEDVSNESSLRETSVREPQERLETSGAQATVEQRKVVAQRLPEDKRELVIQSVESNDSLDLDEDGDLFANDEILVAPGKTETRAEVYAALAQSPLLTAAPITPAESTVRANTQVMADLVTEMVQQISQVSFADRTETLITLQHPPVFDGAQIVIREFKQASGEFSVSFHGLTPEAAALLVERTNQRLLQDGFERRGLTVHILQVTQAPVAETYFTSAGQNDTFREKDREGGSKQEKGSDGQRGRRER